MPFMTLIDPDALRPHLGDDTWALVDCRFALDDPARGRRAYQAGHIPGAVYAHLDDDLSGPVEPGVTGRHPLPDPETFAERLGRWGIDNETQVVAYDDAGGAIAARLWWMLRWLGHQAVAVLDGGFQRWQARGYPISMHPPEPEPRLFVPHPRPELLADADDAAGAVPERILLDARDAARYRGAVEPIDPVAGHIPGAVNAPFKENLDADGCFLPPDALRERFDRLLDGRDAVEAICYCGSGVTAAHNLLAMRHAGLGDARLYAGSWSHWITDEARGRSLG